MRGLTKYEQGIWNEGFGCAIFGIIVVGILAGFLWMVLEGGYWTL